MKDDDMVRISKANSVHSSSAKWSLKSVSTAKIVKRHQQEMEEGPTYGTGMDM